MYCPDMTYEEYVPRTATTEGMQRIPGLHDAPGCLLEHSIPYREVDGLTLHLSMLYPAREREGLFWPAVVYVQGSGWRKQWLGRHLALMSRIAQAGYVVVEVEYRPSDVAPFPAQIEDTQAAVRFVREHAEAYSIDPSRIVVAGDSSGGHTAVMAVYMAAHADMEPLGGEVQGVLDYFGPSDVRALGDCDIPTTMEHLGADSPAGMLIGGFPVMEHPELTEPLVVMHQVDAEHPLPPTLILHGDCDRIVPLEQSIVLFEKLRDCGQPAELYCVEGADHADFAFWTGVPLQVTLDFLARVTAK